MNTEAPSIKVIDSHTAGEPTRVVLAGGPDLGGGSLNERLAVFKTKHDQFRRTVILEPRGYEAMVGALLCRPDNPECETAILFFNNKGFLNMCGHGTIGVAATLAFLDRVSPGKLKFQTTAGIIEVEMLSNNRASFTNVESFCLATSVAVTTEKWGELVGDIAYGGNWFFTVRPPIDLELKNRDQLLGLAESIRGQLAQLNVERIGSAEIDHIQFFVPDVERKRGKSFVVCPGGEFDRSPCGTGTSAVLACLARRGELAPGDLWTQESLTGGVFSGLFQWSCEKHQKVIPTITGEAFVCAVSNLVQHDDDPYRFGNAIRAGD